MFPQSSPMRGADAFQAWPRVILGSSGRRPGAPIASFAAVQEPIRVALLLDTSKSTYPVLDKIKKAASGFLNHLRPRDEAMIVAFDSEIRTVLPLTDDLRELRDELKGVRVGGSVGTRMRDAVIETIGRRSPGRGRAVERSSC